MSECKIYKVLVKEREESVFCDSCRAFFIHYNPSKDNNCSGLTSTEYRSFVLQKKSMIFFCDDCQNVITRVPFKQIDELTHKVADLQEKIVNLQSVFADLKDQSEHGDIEDILKKVEERRRASYNLIVYNVPESKASVIADRIEKDKRVISDCFSEINGRIM